MLIISYNLSVTLKERLSKIEALRKKILLVSVSPHTDIILRWQTMLGHLSGWAILSNQPLTRQHIQTMITSTHTHATSSLHAKVLGYKKALDHVAHEWTANPELVTLKTITALARILSVSHGSDKEIGSLITYLQAKDLNPIIQAAMAHLYFYPNRLCYLVSYLFLAKNGYDLHHWLNLEEYWSSNKEKYLKTLQETTKSATITQWLEYYSQAMIDQMEQVSTFLTAPPTSTIPSIPRSFWHLTDRQRTIIGILAEPGLTITNKDVQQRFKVSQVTASRELTKLSALGLIFPHASGRSTYYSKL